MYDKMPNDTTTAVQAELRRSPGVNGDKGRQEIVNGPKDMGENNGGVE